MVEMGKKIPLLTFGSNRMFHERVNALEQGSDTSGSAGVIVALLTLAGGIISICVRNSVKAGGNIAVLIVFGLVALVAINASSGMYKDLMVWGVWRAVCAVLALVSVIIKRK